MRARWMPALLGALMLGCASEPDARPAASVDALFPDGRRTVAVDELVSRVALAPDESRRMLTLGRDAHTSHHLVALRDGEEPHRHPHHELLVFVLRGYGDMQIGESRRAVGEGSVVYVPRGALHAFRNRGPDPAVAYLIYAPPYEGEEPVPLD